MRRLCLLLGLLICLLSPGAATAHELIPAYLQITQESGTSYTLIWRAPTKSGETLPVRPRLPEDCRAHNLSQTLDGDQRSTLTCEAGLAGRSVTFEGFGADPVDVLVSVTLADTARQTLRATPDTPTVTIAAAPTRLGTLRTYVTLGFAHILEGIDHLAFVLALLLLVGSNRALIKAVTAFTLAHSLTLAASVLGFAGLPSGAVETTIALSIAFLAAEIIRADPDSLSRKAPWMAAFGFGLLHGFGFAGALAEIGLPDGQIPLALLGFNVGIELGQLAFVAAVTALILWPLSKVSLRPLMDKVAAYGLGTLAMAWTFSRLAGL